MRIALLGPAPPFHGGIVAYLARLAARLEARGHALSWHSFRSQYPRWLVGRRAQEGAGAAWLDRPSQPRFVAWSPRSWSATRRDVLAAAPDALVLKYWLPFFAPGFRAVSRGVRGRGVRVVHVVDNVMPHEGHPFARALSRAALAEADGWVVQSESVRRELMALLPAIDPRAVRCVTHPLVDFGAPGASPLSRAAARATLGIEPDERVALCFGYVRRYKGVETLIDAAARLARGGDPRIRVYVAGEIRGGVRTYQDRVHAAGAGAVVRLRPGFVPDERVEAWFRAADVVVLPYLSATQSGVERIASRYGVPVIASTVGGLPEVVGAGSLVPPGDAEALARALARALASPVVPAPLPAEAVRASWDSLCAALEALGARQPR